MNTYIMRMKIDEIILVVCSDHLERPGFLLKVYFFIFLLGLQNVYQSIQCRPPKAISYMIWKFQMSMRFCGAILYLKKITMQIYNCEVFSEFRLYNYILTSCFIYVSFYWGIRPLLDLHSTLKTYGVPKFKLNR